MEHNRREKTGRPSPGEKGAIVQLVIKSGLFLQRELNQACQRNGLSFNQFSVIHEIISRGPVSQKELCDHLFFEKSNLSKIVKSLVDKDYVKVTVAPADRRLTLLIETHQGHQLWQDCLQNLYGSSRDIMSLLSDEESVLLLGQLKRLVKALEYSRKKSIDTPADIGLEKT